VIDTTAMSVSSTGHSTLGEIRQLAARLARWRTIARLTGLPRVEPKRSSGERIVLEGGGIEVNGEGLMLVTEEWLLSDVQVRNPGLTRTDYERIFAEWLGVTRTLWLGEGCVGDDQHGHIDDVARFVAADTIVLPSKKIRPTRTTAVRWTTSDDSSTSRARRRHPSVVTLPFPRPVIMNGERLPASYANFYIGNGVVIVPTFNDGNDRVALNTLASLMPDHQVVGVHAVDLVWGLGTFHCLTQQEPA
jgi:agmatine deiminase